MPAKPAPVPKRKKGESYDAHVARVLAGSGLSATAKKQLEALRTPAVLMQTVKTAPRSIGASRLGGHPDLPPGTKWPRAGACALTFVGQIRLDELPAGAVPALPRRGLLAFFIEEGEDYIAHAKVLHLTHLTGLVPTPPPADHRRYVNGELVNVSYPARGLTFEAARKVPSVSNPRVTRLKLDKATEDFVYRLYSATSRWSQHQLLGYRDRDYDGEQSATTALLLQLYSDPRVEMCWGDVDHLYFYIPEKALAARAFGKAFPYGGD